MTNPHTVAEIASKLTKAQREAILAARQGPRDKGLWINLGTARGPTVNALYRLRLVDDHEPPARLTPLGLAVRQHLTGEQG